MYWTKSKGTGGVVRSEQDFVVDEVPSKKYFKRFSRTESGVKAVEGPYTLALLKKKGITTRDAIRLIQKRFKAKVGYAGLKDKNAVTSQYITVKGDINDIKTDKIELTKIGLTDKMMQVGDLEGNKFVITLRSCKNPENIESIVKEIELRGMPNYFGRQRFGLAGNHKIGKLILLRKYADALRVINKGTRKNYKGVVGIEKKMLKFFIHAYQSFVFNSVIDCYIARYPKPFFGLFPIVGYNTKLKNDFAGRETKKIIKKDGIDIEDFAIKKLNIRCIGSSRDAFIKIKDIDYKASDKTITLKFELPKGSYATALIYQITKNPGRRGF